ncbi:copper transport protein [Hypocenomyce scalaris]|nr:copper transport protein [Hypocenomyce scalaris]
MDAETVLMAREEPPMPRQRKQPEEVLMKIVLATTQSHFESPGILPERTVSVVLNSGKKLLEKSQRNAEDRQLLGHSSDVWVGLTGVFTIAVPALEVQSFASHEPISPTHNGSSSTLMAMNHTTLMQDLERLNDLLTIARNMLATTKRAQNLAADAGFDQQILKLVDVCVRVTARGYDGEAGTRSETQWAGVVGSYKKLLITCLQFLHNFVMHNESRKLLLWLDLFGNSRSADAYFTGDIDPRKDKEAKSIEFRKLLKPNTTTSWDPDYATLNAAVIDSTPGYSSHNESAALPVDEVTGVASELMEMVDGMVGMTLGQGRSPMAPRDLEEAPLAVPSQDTAAPRSSSDSPVQTCKLWNWTNLPDSTLYSDPRGKEIQADDTRIGRTPESAAMTLQAAKDQLMARLQESSPIPGNGDQQDRYGVSENGEDRPDGEEGDTRGSDVAADGSVEDDDGDDDEYHGPGDQERGLLTDIPLVLGPQEIEALPMIIQAGITFGEVKDIVSPAQSIVIKILTQIFRSKQGLPPPPEAANQHAANARRGVVPTRVDLLIVRYIFTVFRQSIIPETCALIYLQGQIRAGAALPEDFPLNLWDMERVYEGVYQFLEFFAVLTESEDWKGLLVRWEIVSELVTLLRELDASIPKAPLGAMPQTAANAAAVAEEVQTSQPTTPAPVAVERPYEPVSVDATFQASEYADISAPESPDPPLDNQDPSDFEWRNLKKLVVLVLSSLVWKSPVVQGQIRKYGGVEMVLSCCNFDANNPYIREHAIMCLRFLLEGNKENQAIVEELEARKVVPDEVLDKRGYETFIDEGGKVGLRRKEGAISVAQTQTQ